MIFLYEGWPVGQPFLFYATPYNCLLPKQPVTTKAVAFVDFHRSKTHLNFHNMTKTIEEL